MIPDSHFMMHLLGKVTSEEMTEAERLIAEHPVLRKYTIALMEYCNLDATAHIAELITKSRDFASDAAILDSLVAMGRKK